MECPKCLLTKQVCPICNKSTCDAHLYKIEDFSWQVTMMTPICVTCYDRVGKRIIQIPRVNLQALLRQARKVVPKGYLAVNLELEEHRPGLDHPRLEFGIYHETFGHFKGSTQQKALEAFTTKVLGVEATTPE